ncbi:efflux RND transporter periplasmic adaptor subunit [Sulfuriferula nivalis]|uniref:Cation transporter n=1 Tax=Sulfuriferula nivalis TaxID=2675298 RepID=A0A809RGM9_9PROT|nr:efflux RND transporter periplasmic adaptor subunit [Sulfuriferula nivalis]BBP00796.1 cation transporter [Sulfuriferula nivalis]
MIPKTLVQCLSGLLAALLWSDAQSAALFDCLTEPTQTVDISSPVVGLLEKVNVQRGDKVRKGQIIANLESTAETASVALALYKSEMTAPTITAENKIKFAKRKYERRRDMQAQDFMSGQERDEAESELKQAEDELKLAQENKAAAKLEWQQQNSLLKLRTIRSPFDGVVVDQSLYPGEVIEPSSQKKSILKLAQLNPLRIYVILPMSAFGKVTHGMKVDVYPESPIGGHFIGTVNIIDRVVNAASGTFSAFLEVANPSLDIPAGVKCKANFPITLEAPYSMHPEKKSIHAHPLENNKLIK